MNHERQIRSLAGHVTDIFSHRFVVQTEQERCLRISDPKAPNGCSSRRATKLI